MFDIPYAPPLTEDRGSRGFVIDLGGTPAANAAAYSSDWPAAIRFITTN